MRECKDGVRHWFPGWEESQATLVVPLRCRPLCSSSARHCEGKRAAPCPLPCRSSSCGGQGTCSGSAAASTADPRARRLQLHCLHPPRTHTENTCHHLFLQRRKDGAGGGRAQHPPPLPRLPPFRSPDPLRADFHSSSPGGAPVLAHSPWRGGLPTVCELSNPALTPAWIRSGSCRQFAVGAQEAGGTHSPGCLACAGRPLQNHGLLSHGTGCCLQGPPVEA